MDLPAALTERPLTLSDAGAVAAVMAAQELADTGEVMIEEADIVGDWQRPTFDLGASTVGVFDGETLVGYAEVSGEGRGDAAVDPSHRGRGIGTALAGWMQERARAQGATEVGMPVPGGSPGERLLTALGYRVRWTSWTLELPEGRTIGQTAPPAGYAVREARAEEYDALHDLLEDAFLEWSERPRESRDDFAARTVRRPGFAPWLLRVAVDPDGQVVGGAVLTVGAPDGRPAGYVERIGVRRDQRRQGLAQALLADAFGAARAHGAVRSLLATDSRTGALGLYERVGMEVTSTWVNLAKTLA